MNNGNVYLVIDDDAFKVDYKWLSKWNYTGDSIVPDGFWENVMLHPVSSENMYIYTVSDNTLKETAYEPMNERFGSSFVPIEDVINSKVLGEYSSNAVRFDIGEYGFLHNYDGTLGTLSYVRDDMVLGCLI